MPEPRELFAQVFGGTADVAVTAHGRVNLIGEHTDYNDGFVLPLAIPQATTVLAASRPDERVRLWSANVSHPASGAEFTLGEERRTGTWTDYVQGVTQALHAGGHRLGGADLYVASDIPVGAGLSSSAALEVATVRAFAALYGFAITPLESARVAHEAEVSFVGVPVGVMDQMASAMARTDAALFIDTRSRSVEQVPLPREVELLVIDSAVPHAHAGGEYRTRRRECDEAARLLGVAALRDATPESLQSAGLPPPLDRRARHVLTENERVLEMRAALHAANVPAAGALMNASHRSMRDDFEVSTAEVDVLVDLAQSTDGVAGARLTGGGFGGCIVALVARGRAADVGHDVVRKYVQRVGRPARVLVP